ARDHFSAQFGNPILSSAPSRRGAPLRDRHASSEAREEPHDFDARRGPRHRTQPQARPADAFRHGTRGQGRRARGSREGSGDQQRDGAPALRLLPPARMRSETTAIVCALRSHGEHGAIVRLMTPDQGLVAAYVRGARGRRMRPVLMAGNVVEAQLSARTDTQLPQAVIELVHSRGPLLTEPLPASAIEWATALTCTALPEGHPYPNLYQALEGLLDAIEAAPSAGGWGAALVRFELLLLAERGFGLDPSRWRGHGADR